MHVPDRHDTIAGLGGAPHIAAPAVLPAASASLPPSQWRGGVVDLPLGRLDGTPAGAAAFLYRLPGRSQRLDPRGDLPHLATLHVDDATDATALGRLWGALLAAGGARGAILSGWDRIGSHLRDGVLAAIRAAATETVLIVDPESVPAGEWRTFAAADALLVPLSRWDGRSAWFGAHLKQIRAIAPAVALAAGADRAALAAALALPLIGAEPPNMETVPAVSENREILSAPDVPVLVTLGTEGDPRQAQAATLHLLNTDPDHPATIDPAGFLPGVAGLFGPFIAETDGTTLVPGTAIELPAGASARFSATRLPPRPAPALAPAGAEAAAAIPRVAIEAVSPAVDSGLFPVKRIAGERVVVEADLICDGHDKLSGALQWRGPMHDAEAASIWREVALTPLGNDRWQADFPVATLGLYEFRVLGWRDAFETFRDEISKKHLAGVPIELELREGTDQIVAALKRHAGGKLDWPLTSQLYALDRADEASRLETLLSKEAADAMRAADDRPGMGTSAIFTVDAERTGAGFASWFEVFPRSMSGDTTRHGTFADVERHLPRIAAMGFDVLYFPPIHPIGRTNRKGPNNTLTPGETDPGSPYAIGTAEGGHDALHPELGTLDDFLHLREAAAAHGLELAIDFAIQCSPDHPWLREHRDWFAWRPDGSIRYAENPPKKYQDIVNVDFYAKGAIPELWLALARVVLFWAENGIRLFRVDNPHTKPLPFWQWLIAEVRARFPDAVFLAEAFTRPKVMNRLAKIGFSQSYTYFTWRNTRPELEEYLTTLTSGPEREFFRPHFFVNTPDINPTFLQTGGRPGHLIRAALAATLSGLWGVYNGFELCEATPLAPGKEEYLDSEKFELRAWDTDRPGNIIAEITRLNAIRRANPALHRTGGLAFLPSSDHGVIAYEKATDTRDNVICCFVSLDPHNIHDTRIELPLWKSGRPGESHVEIEDLMSGARFGLDGAWHDLRLTPEMPFILWRLLN